MAPSPTLLPHAFDITAARSAQDDKDHEWATQHPLSSIGYTSQLLKIGGPEGYDLSVKLSYPAPHRLGTGENDLLLPIMLIAHGGGYISGSHTSEESWLVWPLYKEFNMVFISVEYRLAPEHPFPAGFEDCWYILQLVLSSSDEVFSDLQAEIDLTKIFLAGSSAGAGICAALSQKCRDNSIVLAGVILNVPMLCNYYHRPANQQAMESYQRCYEAMPNTSALLWVWKILQPSRSLEPDVRLSPLLGDCVGLARHALFVAGEDPLFDEGIAFAGKLRLASVPVHLKIYSDMPHGFAQNWELNETRKFWNDLHVLMRTWLRGPSTYPSSDNSSGDKC